MALTRRDVLRGMAVGCALPMAAPARAPARPPRLILVLATGGWDPSYCIDPKLGVPEVDDASLDEVASDLLDREAIKTFHGLPILVNEAKRPSVRRFFEGWGDRVAIVNGVSVGSIVHTTCTRRILSGSNDAGAPDLATVVGHVHGQDLPIGCLDLASQALPGGIGVGSARVGFLQQLGLILDDEERYPAMIDRSAGPDTADLDAVRSYLRSASTADPRLASVIDDVTTAADRAARLRADPGAVATLAPGTPMNLVVAARVAVDGLAQGLCQSVLMSHEKTWDTHANHASQHDLYEGLFDGLDLLAAELWAAGLMDDTVVCVVSEMGRTPRRNAMAGKDHWPITSVLCFGGPIVGARTHGGTEGGMVPRSVDLQTGEVDAGGTLLTQTHVAAGLLEAVGIDPQPFLPGSAPFGGWRT